MSQHDYGEYHYARALEGIQQSSPDSDEAQQEHYLLMAYGNALAAQEGWLLRGIDAIDYALIKRYGWSPLVLRELSAHEKGLALHEALQALSLDDAAVKVWQESFGRHSHMDKETLSLEALWYPNGEWPST